MKPWLYGALLMLLPLVYLGVTLGSGNPVDWTALAMIALITVPLMVLLKRGHKAPPRAPRPTAPTDGLARRDEDLPPAARLLGLAMLGAAAILYGAEFVLAHVLFVYVPYAFLLIGPLTTLGVLITIHPVFVDALSPSRRASMRPKTYAALRWTTYLTLVAGLVLGMMLWGRMRDGP
jgi:hypothetical protein